MDNNATIANNSCQSIKEYIVDMDLNCSEATSNLQHIKLGERRGMNILGIIVFTVAFALCLGHLGEDGRTIVSSIGVLNEAIMKLVTLVMW